MKEDHVEIAKNFPRPKDIDFNSYVQRSTKFKLERCVICNTPLLFIRNRKYEIEEYIYSYCAKGAKCRECISELNMN